MAFYKFEFCLDHQKSKPYKYLNDYALPNSFQNGSILVLCKTKSQLRRHELIFVSYSSYILQKMNNKRTYFQDYINFVNDQTNYL